MKFKNTFSLCLLFVCMFAVSTVNAQEATEEEKPRTQVLIKTSMGDIKIELFNETKLHRKNFLMLAKSGQYNGSIFHRVIRDFMIQGGELKNPRRPDYTLPAEINHGYVHTKGMVSAARKPDSANPMKASSGSQFYIVQGTRQKPTDLDAMSQRNGIKYTDKQKLTYETLGGTPFLDGQYTIFGRVIEGMEVLEKIAAVKVGGGSKPLKEITMTMKVILL